MVQPSTFTAECSKTKGPRFSTWHCTHVSHPLWRSVARLDVPCGLWQSVHFIALSDFTQGVGACPSHRIATDSAGKKRGDVDRATTLRSIELRQAAEAAHVAAGAGG